jgi:hypothetical protein
LVRSIFRGGCRTPLAKKFNFKDPEKIREIARRGEALRTQDAQEDLQRKIENGRAAFISTSRLSNIGN